MCVVWCCCCKSMPSYFLIPSIAVLFCYWHQTPPATPLLCCLSPRPAAQTKQQPPQQARSRQQPAGQHAAICRASSAVRLRGFVAPSSAGLDRAVAVSVAGAVVVRQPAAVPKHEQWEMTPSSRVVFRSTGGEKRMHENDATREKGSTDSGLRSILTVTRGCTFFFFARCRSLAAAWRVLVAVVSSRRRFERKRAKCAWPVARPVLTRALRTLDGQMPSQKRMTTAVSQGQSLACQRRAST